MTAEEDRQKLIDAYRENKKRTKKMMQSISIMIVLDMLTLLIGMILLYFVLPRPLFLEHGIIVLLAQAIVFTLVLNWNQKKIFRSTVAGLNVAIALLNYMNNNKTLEPPKMPDDIELDFREMKKMVENKIEEKKSERQSLSGYLVDIMFIEIVIGVVLIVIGGMGWVVTGNGTFYTMELVGFYTVLIGLGLLPLFSLAVSEKGIGFHDRDDNCPRSNQ